MGVETKMALKMVHDVASTKQCVTLSHLMLTGSRGFS